MTSIELRTLVALIGDHYEMDYGRWDSKTPGWMNYLSIVHQVALGVRSPKEMDWDIWDAYWIILTAASKNSSANYQKWNPTAKAAEIVSTGGVAEKYRRQMKVEQDANAEAEASDFNAHIES